MPRCWTALSGAVVGRGLEALPARAELVARVRAYDFPEIPAARAEMESRVAYCYEVDGACPCDDTICRLAVNGSDTRRLERTADHTVDEHASMGEALAIAERALAAGEFPVGSVMVCRGRIVARGGRQGSAAEGLNELDHAEMVALRGLYDVRTAGPGRGHGLLHDGALPHVLRRPRAAPHRPDRLRVRGPDGRRCRGRPYRIAAALPRHPDRRAGRAAARGQPAAVQALFRRPAQRILERTANSHATR